MENQERWIPVFERRFKVIIDSGLQTLDCQAKQIRSVEHGAHLGVIPYCALLHLIDCIATVTEANAVGLHSVCACLMRQSVEALTLIDIGLQDEGFSFLQLRAWNERKKTTGHLRQELQKVVWPHYGTGLWNEPWSEFFGNLARAVQPYAHYTQQLQMWQFHIVDMPITGDKDGITCYAKIGSDPSDQEKSEQIGLLQALAVWTLGRLLLNNSRTPQDHILISGVRELGEAIAESSILDQRFDWDTQLIPILFPANKISLSGLSEIDP